MAYDDCSIFMSIACVIEMENSHTVNSFFFFLRDSRRYRYCGYMLPVAPINGTHLPVLERVHTAVSPSSPAVSSKSVITAATAPIPVTILHQQASPSEEQYLPLGRVLWRTSHSPFASRSKSQEAPERRDRSSSDRAAWLLW